MYASRNFATKKALKEALARGEKIGVWQPGPFGPAGPHNGPAYLEGPWEPQPHRWYARVEVRDGRITKVH